MIESEVLAIKTLLTAVCRTWITNPKTREQVAQIVSDKIATAALKDVPEDQQPRIRKEAAIIVAEILAP